MSSCPFVVPWLSLWKCTEVPFSYLNLSVCLFIELRHRSFKFRCILKQSLKLHIYANDILKNALIRGVSYHVIHAKLATFADSMRHHP